MTTSYFANLVAGGAPEKSNIGVGDILAQTGADLHKKKENTIINLAKHLASILAISFTGSTQEEALEFIRKRAPIPTPHMNSEGKKVEGKRVKPSVDAHLQFCQSMGKAINSEYKREIINLNDEPAVICNNVMQILDSITATVGSELTAVKVDLKRVIGNIEAMLAVLEKSEKHIFDVAVKNESAQPNNSVQLNAMYKAATDELNKYLVMLKNLLKVVDTEPDAAMARLLSETPDFKHIVEDVKSQVGSPEFGSRIVAILYSMGDVAARASIVGEALKKIGMSLQEYKTLTSVNALTEAAYKAFESRKKKPSADEISEFIAALETLRSHQYMQSQVVNEFAKNKKNILGGFEAKWMTRSDNINGGEENDFDELVNGGCGCQPTTGGSVYKTDTKTKKLERVAKTTDALLRDFARGIDQKYDNIATQLTVLATALKNNTDIFQTEEYKLFFEGLETFKVNNLITEKLAYALTTARIDETARIEKAGYLGKITKMQQLIKPFTTSSAYGTVFVALERAFAAIPAYIDAFTERYLTALTSVEKPSTEIAGGDAAGGSESGQEKMEAAINTLRYYEKVNKIRKALKLAHGEIKSYTQDYDKVLGEAMAIQTAHINKIYNNTIKEFGETGTVGLWLDEKKGSKPTTSTPSPADLTDPTRWAWRKVVVDDTRELVERQHAARIDFIKTIEALDIYMKNFTDSVQVDPNDALDIVDMLKNVDILVKWQNAKSGDNLAKFFECFPLSTTPVLPASGKHTEYAQPLTGEYLSDIIKSTVIGDITKPSVKAKLIEESAKRAVSSVKVLSNLLSIFNKVGAKHTSVTNLMPIQTMLANFAKYLVYSSFTIEVTPTPTVAGAATNWYPKITARTVPDNKGATALDIKSAKDQDRKDAKTTFDMDNNDTHIGQTLDNLFIRAVKAMMAKVITLTGLYGALEKPLLEKQPTVEFTVKNPLRVVLGAAEKEPEVDTKLTELYIRLPLIAEYYRGIFSNTTPTDINYKADDYRITLVPEIQSLWTPFINLMFIDLKNNGDAPYTRSQLYRIITEINEIAAKYNRDPFACMDGFKKEMNRRYGLIKAAELKEYDDAKKNRKTKLDGDTNIDVFSNDMLTDTARMTLPSDKYDVTIAQTIASDLKTPDLRDSDLDAFYQLVDKFREKIDNSLTDVSSSASPSDYFKSFVQFANDMKKAATNSERMNILENIMHGYERFKKSDAKALMWHECVVWPLEIVTKLHIMLGKVKSNVETVAATAPTLVNFVNSLNQIVSDSNNLVDVKIHEQTAAIDTSALERLTLRLLSFAKHNIEKFRTVVLDTVLTDTEKLLYREELKHETHFGDDEKDNTINKINTSLSTIWAKLAADTTLANDIMSIIWRAASSTTATTTMSSSSSTSPVLTSLTAPVVSSSSSTSSAVAPSALSTLSATSSITMTTHTSSITVSGNPIIKPITYDMKLIDDKKMKIEQNAITTELDAGIQRYIAYIATKLTDSLSLNYAQQQTKQNDASNIKTRVVAAFNRIIPTATSPNASWVSAIQVLNTEVDAMVNYVEQLATERKEAPAKVAGGAPVADIAWTNWPFQFIPQLEEPRTEADRTKLKSLVDQLEVLAKADAGYTNRWQPLLPIGATVDAKTKKQYDTVQDEYIRLSNMFSTQEAKRQSTWYVEASTFDESATVNGLIGAVNRMLSRYLYSCFDETTGKVYKGAIAGIATARSLEVMSGSAIDDVGLADPTGIPASGSILYRTLALAIRNIMTNTDKKTNLPIFAYTSLIDVPQHIKDHMRASLPSMDRIFQHIANYAEMQKRIVNFMTFTDSLPAGIPSASFAPYPNDAAKFKAWCNSTIDEIVSVVATIRKSISDTRKELSDDPRYMELYPGFFRDFVAQHKKQPTVLSSQLALATSDRKYILPFHTVGNQNMKYIYATRGVIGNAAMPDRDVFNVRDVLDAYNGNVPATLRIDSDEYQTAMIDILTATKYQVELRTRSMIFDNTYILEDFKSELASDLNDTLTITSSADQSYIIDKIQNFVKSKVALPITRAKIRIDNIIDLGFMPFNVHAIARNVPLTFLYNYAYTFDQIVQEKHNADKLMMITSYPYAHLNPAFLPDIIEGKGAYDSRGATKYVKSELYNKAACQLSTNQGVKTEGQKRVDSIIARNLAFLCHMHRFVRYWINDKLVQYKEPSATGLEILSEKLIVE